MIGMPSRPEPVRPVREPVFNAPSNPMQNPIGNPARHIPMFHKGTDYVPHTGPAMLEKGEAVIPKEKNMNGFDGAKDVLGGHQKGTPKKEIKEMVHSKSHNGKHIVVHKHHHPAHHPDETHVLNDMAELHAHMDDHAGPQSDDSASASGGEPATPMTPSPSPMQGM